MFCFCFVCFSSKDKEEDKKTTHTHTHTQLKNKTPQLCKRHLLCTTLPFCPRTCHDGRMATLAICMAYELLAVLG